MKTPKDGVAWRPVRIESPGHLAELVDRHGIEVVDTVEQQQRDLAKILPAPDRRHLEESTRWLYYPWRHCAVHVLGPLGFEAVRSDRNRNKISIDEQRMLRRLTIGIVGLSSGYAIAHGLALEGVAGQLRLADFDHVELSNLNRIPGTVFDLGMNKSVVAARRISELDPYLDVRIEPDGLDLRSTAAFMDGLDVVIEQCDSFDIKFAVREAARRRRIPVMMATADRGAFDIERFDLEPTRRSFHGLMGEAQAEDVVDLPTAEKVSSITRILGSDQLSARLLASMAEMGTSLSTWPQLGSDIYLGAATAVAAVRRLGLGDSLPSGRLRVDLDELLASVVAPAIT